MTQRRALVFIALLIFVFSMAFLIITSTPDGAQLFIDDKLISATNNTLNLPPGEYQVEIKKDGFTSWKKTLPIKKELVVKTDAYLFPTFPDLRPLTFTGASNPIVSPDGQKVVFAVSGASADKDGLWILDLADRPLGFPREPRQIVKSAPRGRDFSDSTYVWSPDSKQILVTFKDRPGIKLGQLVEENFLLDANQLNLDTSLIDVTQGLTGIYSRWEEEEALRQEAKISKLPKKLLEILEETSQEIIFSPDETKILYTATASASIPEEIIPPLPAANAQPESRDLEPGKIYVYDLKEDKNFYLMDKDESKTLSWFPTSKHLFLVQEEKITIFEYDNTNWVDVYTGPFENSFAFPFPAGNKILILTTLGSDTPPNLYAINLR